MAIRGVRRLRRAFRSIVRDVDRGVDERLDDQARRLLGSAIAVAPELTRRLILSGSITKRSGGGRSIRVIDFDTPYAVVQHENQLLLPGPLTSRKAATQDGEAGAKFLERPYRRLLQTFIREIGQVPNRVVRRRRR